VKILVEEKLLVTPIKKGANLDIESSELVGSHTESSTKASPALVTSRQIFESEKDISKFTVIEVIDMKIRLKLTNAFPQSDATTNTSSNSLPRKNSLKKYNERQSGLQNIGNTCYLNSTIQCLKRTNPLLSILEQLNTSTLSISQELISLLHLLHNQATTISPQKFKRTIDSYTDQFPTNKQCDAHEFLSFLINKLHDEALTINKSIAATLYNNFYGESISTIQCIECKEVSSTKEIFMCISLPIDEETDRLLILLQTATQHLFYLSCKFDDEETTIGELKDKIQRDLIIQKLSIYIMIEDNIEVMNDAIKIGQILSLTKPWRLYAIEDTKVFIKLNIGKSDLPLLLSLPKEVIKNSKELQNTLKRLLLGSMNEAHHGFTLVNQREFNSSSGLVYYKVELRSNRSSYFSDILSKLTQKEIDLLKHKTVLKNSLEDCLHIFTSSERLKGVNRWICGGCNKSTDAYKKLSYLHLPQILMIHLKRFKVQCKKQRVKIFKLIKFPELLTLERTDKLKERFKLYAIINHVGDIERGHYTAICREENSTTGWILYDDNKVSEVENIVTSNAYVLFYEKLDNTHK